MGPIEHSPAEVAGKYLLSIARKAIQWYVEKGVVLEIPSDEEIPPSLRERKASFVSIKKKNELRGCIGTMIPQRKNLLEETVFNAIDAAVSDPRFLPITPEELAECTISVDVLSALEKVQSKKELDPEKYGVYVIQGGHAAVLLPALPRIHTVEEQLAIVMRKGGMDPSQPYEIYRFTVQRWQEKQEERE